MRARLRMAGRDHAALFRHLFPGDQKEAIALALCGSTVHEGSEVLTVHKLFPVPHEICEREEDFIKWPSSCAVDLLNEASKKRLKVLKIHSHPTGHPDFSKTDDASDHAWFRTVSEWIDAEMPGMSAIMFPDQSILARAVDGEGDFHEVESVVIAGADIRIWHPGAEKVELQEHTVRTAQTFGRKTTKLLSELTVGVVGVSGTGSPVVEMLFRSGVGELVLVDGDVIEKKNLNRILHSTLKDAEQEKPKVFVAAEAIERTGLPTRVKPIHDSLFKPAVIRQLAQCDIIFGCMDSTEGRHVLNTLCTFYCIPYFDLGVGLNTDEVGGISRVSGNVHYLQPGGSSLLTRRVVTRKRLEAESLYRTARGEYFKRKGEGYIEGVDEDSPAVISVNTLIAALSVNDFLARLHPYRSDDNDAFAVMTIDLLNSRMVADTPDGEPDPYLSQKVGRGDMIPFLNTPGLTDEEPAT